MIVLGISGSPVKNSNTDRAVRMVMEATMAGKQWFYKLSDYTISPCNACLGCVKTNRCIIADDGVMLAEKAFKADIVIVGGYTPYSSLDSRTKAFMERLYALRHRHGLMAGKPGAAVVTCAVPPGREGMPPAGENGLQAIRFCMMEEGMRYVGGVSVLGNVPCVKCKSGSQCRVSGVKMIHGPDAAAENVGINTLEQNPETVAALRKLGRDLAAAYYGE
ncbi:MAG: NADPH-dependent FMN reductase [Desulfobulbaceae bacterium DB1]|nr:MAG: NADPH-dependent FMN reductase [Desulfobulbaceae bacterium DB1]